MSRNLLHKGKLCDFKQWLSKKGIQHREGRGDFQVLQVALPGNQWGVVYDRITAPEHYTVTAPMESLVRRFIQSHSALTEAEADEIHARARAAIKAVEEA
jgi:hypothetical protein